MAGHQQTRAEQLGQDQDVARPGDILVLTKLLGTGLLVSGHRQGRPAATDEAFQAAVDGMRRLNRTAADILVANGVQAATDVTGFGLVGHGLEMARASASRFVFDGAGLPALDGALDLARAGVETGGAGHNRRFAAAALTIEAGCPAELVTLAHDPQTSGGLLAAIAPDRIERVEAAFADAGVPSWRVGWVEAADDVAGPGVTLRAGLPA